MYNTPLVTAIIFGQISAGSMDLFLVFCPNHVMINVPCFCICLQSSCFSMVLLEFGLWCFIMFHVPIYYWLYHCWLLSLSFPFHLSIHHYAFWQIGLAVCSAFYLLGVCWLSPSCSWDSVLKIWGWALNVIGSGYYASGLCYSSLSSSFPAYPCPLIVLYIHGPQSSCCTATVYPVGSKGIFIWLSASLFDRVFLFVSTVLLFS